MCGHASGNTPCGSEELTMVVIIGSNWSRQLTTNWVGIGSKLHDFLADFFVIALISPSDNSLNDSKAFAHSTLGPGGTSCKSDEIDMDSISFRMSSIVF